MNSDSPPIPEAPTSEGYDADGNLTSDGRWNYTWDGENRLIRMVANTTVGPQQRIDFQYDWQGRRIAKTVWNNKDGTGTPALEQRFLYDGWNLVQVLSSGLSLQTFFVWGSDLSGSLQGAGGVGGLLAVSQITSPSVVVSYFVAYDGNGNVAGLVNAANGEVSARYEYGPFGEVVRSTGPMAKANPFRFSTKYQDDETDLLYYGYRYFSSGLGRWLSRDPIAEAGGFHLYAFCANNPVRYIDAYGRDITDWTWVEPAANFAAGVGDSLTMGISSWLRGKMDIDQVDYSSGLYYVGEATEFAVETTVTLGSGALYL